MLLLLFILVLGIIRVGSRCQNSTIQQFSLKNKRQSVRVNHALPVEIYLRKRRILSEKIRIEKLIHSKQSQIEKSKTDLVLLSSFNQYNIIDQRHRFSLVGFYCTDESDQKTLLQWLGFYEFRYAHRPTTSTPQKHVHSYVTEMEVNDITEEVEEEERRRADDIDMEEYGRQKYIDKSNTVIAPEDKCKNAKYHQFIQSIMANPTTLNDETVKQIHDDVWQLRMKERINLYRYWLFEYRQYLQTSLNEGTQEYSQVMSSLSEYRENEDYHLLKDSAIVAMTTACAAKHHKVLEKLRMISLF